MGEEDKLLLLLCSLPPSYDLLVMMLLYSKETLEYEDMVSVLRSNKQQEKLTKEDTLQEGLAMGERSGRERKKGMSKRWSKSRKSKSKKEARCYKCNEIGHFKRDCLRWKNKKRDTGGSDALSMVADSEVEDDLLVVSDGHRQNANVWTLDSACLHHYILNQSWFATYTKMDEGSMTLEDDLSCRVTGIGSIQMRMFDGMVQTLTNMKHVPDLKKNFM